MVGTVDANTAFYQRFHLDEIPKDQLLELGPRQIVSSASLPGLFIPTYLDGSVYVDGGTAMGLDAISAVEKCLELVEDESQITLDIILLDRFADVQIEDVDGETWREQQWHLRRLRWD